MKGFMATKQKKIIEKCDSCGLAVAITPGQEVTQFEAAWHSSMTLTLCPECKLSEQGLEMIIAANLRVREGLDNFVW